MAVHAATVTDTICLWCGKGFTPRRDGGKRQVFCCPVCRRAFDAAGRQWVAEAIAIGVLTVQELNDGLRATRAFVPADTRPAPASARRPQHPTPVAPRAEARYTPQQQLELAMAQAVAMRRR
jgi:hypothetical protein